MTIPAIDDLPTAPTPTDSRSVLNTRMFNFLAAFATFRAQILAAISAAVADFSAAIIAASSADITGTSTTSLTVGTGSKVFATQSGKRWAIGMRLRASDSTGVNLMDGEVTAYSGTSLTISVDRIEGAGTIASWSIVPIGSIGPAGPNTLSNSDISGAKVVGFFAEYDNGSSGSAKTIALSNGQKQKVTLSVNTTLTISFTGALVGTYQLRLIQDTTGSRTVTWSGISSSRWLGSASTPSINTAANTETLVNIFYDGTNATQSLAKVGAV